MIDYTKPIRVLTDGSEPREFRVYAKLVNENHVIGDIINRNGRHVRQIVDLETGRVVEGIVASNCTFENVPTRLAFSEITSGGVSVLVYYENDKPVAVELL